MALSYSRQRRSAYLWALSDRPSELGVVINTSKYELIEFTDTFLERVALAFDVAPVVGRVAASEELLAASFLLIIMTVFRSG